MSFRGKTFSFEKKSSPGPLFKKNFLVKIKNKNKNQNRGMTRVDKDVFGFCTVKSDIRDIDKSEFVEVLDMRYLPILSELFSSDSAIFMLIGLVIATIIGIKMKNVRKNTIGVAICLITYVVCEIISQVVGMNYLVEIIALFVGTIAIGGFIGFLIGLIVSKVRK